MTYQETTYCPNCNHEVIVPAEHGDDPIDCPGCGKAIAQSALVPGWTNEVREITAMDDRDFTEAARQLYSGDQREAKVGADAERARISAAC